jgi:hypothetical protein
MLAPVSSAMPRAASITLSEAGDRSTAARIFMDFLQMLAEKQAFFLSILKV